MTYSNKPGETPRWLQDQWEADVRENPMRGGCLAILLGLCLVVIFVGGILTGRQWS